MHCKQHIGSGIHMLWGLPQYAEVETCPDELCRSPKRPTYQGRDQLWRHMYSKVPHLEGGVIANRRHDIPKRPIQQGCGNGLETYSSSGDVIIDWRYTPRSAHPETYSKVPNSVGVTVGQTLWREGVAANAPPTTTGGSPYSNP